MLNIFFLQYASAEQEEEGRKRYEAQKMERLETKARPEEMMPSPPNPGNIFKLRVPYHLQIQNHSYRSRFPILQVFSDDADMSEISSISSLMGFANSMP